MKKNASHNRYIYIYIYIYIISWIVLLTCTLLLFRHVRNLTPELDTPDAPKISVQDSKLTLSWSPVEYATCYSIHFREPGGEWQIADIVTTRSYTFPKSVDREYELFIRAGNKSLGNTFWSAYSPVQFYSP